MTDQSGATGTPESITFEAGYEELKRIVARLGEDDVSVHEMFQGFARGKGLEKSLRAYLTQREGELTEIEQGRNLPEFRIVAPSSDDARPETGDLQRAPKGGRFMPQPPGVAEDDIPF